MFLLIFLSVWIGSNNLWAQKLSCDHIFDNPKNKIYQQIKHSYLKSIDLKIWSYLKALGWIHKTQPPLLSQKNRLELLDLIHQVNTSMRPNEWAYLLQDIVVFEDRDPALDEILLQGYLSNIQMYSEDIKDFIFWIDIARFSKARQDPKSWIYQDPSYQSEEIKHLLFKLHYEKITLNPLQIQYLVDFLINGIIYTIEHKKLYQGTPSFYFWQQSLQEMISDIEHMPIINQHPDILLSLQSLH